MKKINVIIYIRVSTDEQAKNGHGRDYQLEALKKYCEKNKYKIIGIYEEDHSAKNFNRPEWKKLESYVKANRKSVDKILFTKWDRFSRNMREALSKLKLFSNYGIEVNATEQRLDLSNPDNKLMLSFYLMSPEVENDKIAQRTRAGMFKAAKEGAWIGRVPFGYERCRYGKYASIKFNDNADLVREIFNEASTYKGSLEQLRRKFKEKGYDKCKQSFYNLLKNRVYLGMSKVPKFEKQDTFWVDGLHDGIVDLRTFNKVQNIILGKRNKARFPSKKKEQLPLRGFLECGYCGRNLTGSTSTGNGGKYNYYHCRKGCKNRILSHNAHTMFKEQVLDKITVNENVLSLYKEILRDVQSKKRNIQKINRTDLERQIKDKQNGLELTEDKYINGDISKDTFERISDRYSSKLRDLRAELQMINESQLLSSKIIDRACNVLRTMPQLFENGDYEQKTNLLGLMFPKKLIISKKECRTKEQNVVIELLTRVNKVSKRLDKKKAIRNDGLSNYAPPLGLEPRTL